MPTTDETLPHAAHVAQGPGTMLRQAREALGLDREGLAQRLRLELRIVAAIEDEAWERLPGPAYTRGYIRSIAKELGIDPSPALAQYAALANVAEPTLGDFKSRPPAQITSSSKRIQLISYGLGVVVLVLVVAWWQRQYGSHPERAAEDSPSAHAGIAPEPSIPLPYSWTIVEHIGGPLEPPKTLRRQTDGTTPPVAEEVVPVSEAPPSAARDVTAGDAAAQTPTPTAPAAPTGELVLAAKRDTWVEITDMKRARLYFGLVKGGAQIAVTGTPPYELVIGNAPAVTLTYRGDTVDVMARAVNGVARMAVGEP